jgi:uncharacterized protein
MQQFCLPGEIMVLSEQLLEILACPACKGGLAERDGGLFCAGCSLRFPVRDGIPVLLMEEAEKG